MKDAMKDVMIDLETFDTTYNAVICQIGACYFNRYTGEIGDNILLNIDVGSSIKEGFSIGASTLYWWLEQSNEARASIIDIPRMNVNRAIIDINIFLGKAKQIWSHATFDFVILMNHFEKLGITPIFHYVTARDLRTLVDLANLKNWPDRDKGNLRHNALDDCKYQVKYAVQCFNSLKQI